MAKKYTADIIEATSITGSLLGTATLASALVPGNKTVEGDLTVTGKITAEEFHTEYVSSSIVYQSGSTKFGDSSDDVMSVTGSLQVQGSITGSLFGTATNAVSSSYAVTSSYAHFAATPTVQGVQGTQGIQGIQGLQGADGYIGVDGAQGIQGIQGLQGVQGTQGIQGVAGDLGGEGTQGVQGIQGLQGRQGTQGVQGTAGSNGAQGTQGIQGTTGSTGSQGTQGIQGTNGSNGSQGTQGIQGTTGAQGIQGIQGVQGTNAGITSYTNAADNRVITSVSSTTINAEANLTFDGSTLAVAGTSTTTRLANTFTISPHTSGVDLHSTGNFAPHYQTDFAWYTGAIGAGTNRATLNSSGDFTANASSRAPIFYDSDNTGYYVNPASTSNLNGLTVAGTISGNISGTAGGVAWGNVSSKPSYLMYYQGFTLDANTMDSNSTGFTYAVNAPFYGPVARFSTGGGYDLWLGGSYGSGGNGFHIRTRNGDAGTYNSWKRLWTDGDSTVSATGDFRAPIFYDSNDTTYYFDGTGGTRQSKYLTISGGGSGNNGNELVVGNTTVQYSLQDTNLRPIIQATGAYPVLTLNHTVTSNGSHGATVQFTSNGTGNQFVIGSSGNGTRLDIGTSSNSSWNPHNGIDGYQGTTGWRMDTSGNVFNLVSNRSPIYYDNNNTAYYVDPNSTSNILNIGLNGYINFNGSGTSVRISESYGILMNCVSTPWNVQMINTSLLVGFSASGGNYGIGNGYFTGDVTAYYSDRRLKHNLVPIDNAVEKVKSLNGYTYQHNELGQELLNENAYKVHAGLIAQEVQAVLPEVVTIAPFDLDGYDEQGKGISKSGEEYLTIKYERIVPLLIEAIKEQQTQIENQQSQIDELKALVKTLVG